MASYTLLLMLGLVGMVGASASAAIGLWRAGRSRARIRALTARVQQIVEPARFAAVGTQALRDYLRRIAVISPLAGVIVSRHLIERGFAEQRLGGAARARFEELASELSSLELEIEGARGRDVGKRAAIAIADVASVVGEVAGQR